MVDGAVDDTITGRSESGGRSVRCDAPRAIAYPARSTSRQSSALAPTARCGTNGLEGNAGVWGKAWTAFIDDVTGLIFAVKKTTPESTAQVSIKLPGNDIPSNGIRRGTSLDQVDTSP